MKTQKIFLLFILSLFLLVISCNKENGSNIEGTITNQSECKSSDEPAFKSTMEDDESCIEYSYDSKSKILTLTHINSGFNCCPGELSVDVKLIENTIEITEKEEATLCNCDCLFDIEIEITGVENEIYFIKVIEPYCGDQEKLEFEIDLTKTIEGSYCVERTKYPWGMIN